MPLKGDRLKQLRLDRGYTREELSEFAGIGSNQVYRYENNLTDPPTDILVRLSKTLGVTADYLLGMTDNPSGEIHMSDLSDDEQNLIAAYRQKRAAVLLEAATRIVQDQEQSRISPLKPAANS